MMIACLSVGMTLSYGLKDGPREGDYRGGSTKSKDITMGHRAQLCSLLAIKRLAGDPPPATMQVS